LVVRIVLISEVIFMSSSRLVLLALLCFLAFQAAASDATKTVTNQVNLSVVRYDDHFLVECGPKDNDTSARNDWKSICNQMAEPQISKLAADGIIASVAGPIFDLSNDLVSSGSGQTLSKNIPLSK